MIKKFILSASLILSTLPLSTMADDGLYPDAPPADAAFVRVVNISDTPLSSASLSGVALPELKSHQISNYAVVKQGDINITIDNMNDEKALLAGQYYTFVPFNNAINLIEDKKPENPSKAVINFYNLSDIESVSLVSTTHNADIFKDIKNGSHDAREINAVSSIGLAVKNTDQIVAELNDIKLERHVNTSIFFIGHSDQYDVILKNNTPYK